jgi:hypothetical protein
MSQTDGLQAAGCTPNSEKYRLVSFLLEPNMVMVDAEAIIELASKQTVFENSGSGPHG